MGVDSIKYRYALDEGSRVVDNTADNADKVRGARSGASRGRRYSLLVAVLILGFTGVPMTSFAGKHAFQELTYQLGGDIRDILIKHGMPVRQDRGNPWLSLVAGSDRLIGGDPSFGIFLNEAHDIPPAAQMEIIQYLMTLHEARGRRERFQLQMRTEARKPGIFKPKPYFDLILNVTQ